MTPLIDIVFLLIIFFLVISQFIDAENFPIAVADECNFAQSDPENKGQIVTLTVLKEKNGAGEFAVGSEKIENWTTTNITQRLAEMIDNNLKDRTSDQRIVTLRIDSDVPFSQAQFALAGVAASSASDIRLAVLKEKRKEQFPLDKTN